MTSERKNEDSKLIKTGIVGCSITALCCFTPVLVWGVTAIGLTAMIGYLDMVLFPLLGLFVVILAIGLRQKKREEV